MYRTNLFGQEAKGVSKEIKKKVSEVVDALQLDLRIQNANRQQSLQKMYIELKKMAIKINEFSNLLLNDDFNFQSLQQHPLILTRYCELMFTILIDNFNAQSVGKSEAQKGYNQNDIYSVMAATKLQNFDLKEKISNIEKQLELAKQRAECAQLITEETRNSTQDFLKNYQQNFVRVCDLLKKAQNNEVELLQNNRYLKEQLQSLSIQFERYKEYFKLGPTLKEKQFKMKAQLQRQYEAKLKNAIKQVQTSIKTQLQRSVVEKFHLKNIKHLRF